MNRLIIIGASGHGKVVADIAGKNGYTDIVFLDDDEQRGDCAGYPVIGKVSACSELTGDKFVAIGNSEIRRRIMDSIGPCVTLIHPAATVADDVVLGEGTVVMAGAVINPAARIGKGCIINTCSSVDHDCVIGDYCHISVGAHLCGSVAVGNGTWIAVGASIANNVSIPGNSIIGAGAVVIKDINEPGTYVGAPARKIK